MAKWCMQCGTAIPSRAVEAVGVDGDGDPACTAHAVKNQELCDCGKTAGHRGRCLGPRKVAQRSEPIIVPRGRKSKKMSLVEVRQELKAVLEAKKREIDGNLSACDTVIEMVKRADASNTAAEFLGN
jgi:hypothetical protein